MRMCGQALPNNDRVIDEPGINRVRRDVGMVFQSFNLFAHLTVPHNITLHRVRLAWCPGHRRRYSGASPSLARAAS